MEFGSPWLGNLHGMAWHWLWLSSSVQNNRIESLNLPNGIVIEYRNQVNIHLRLVSLELVSYSKSRQLFRCPTAKCLLRQLLGLASESYSQLNLSNI